MIFLYVNISNFIKLWNGFYLFFIIIYNNIFEMLFFICYIVYYESLDNINSL